MKPISIAGWLRRNGDEKSPVIVRTTIVVRMAAVQQRLAANQRILDRILTKKV